MLPLRRVGGAAPRGRRAVLYPGRRRREPHPVWRARAGAFDHPTRTRPARTPALTAPPISDYALLSDCQGAALLSRHGSIDWWCAPRFDSPSSLGRILDPEAGHWEIRADEPVDVERRYLPDTMVVETTLSGRDGRVRLTDALAFADGAREHAIGHDSPHCIVRLVECLEGAMRLRMRCAPRLEYGLVRPELVACDGLVVTSGGADRLLMRADGADLTIAGHAIEARLDLRAGERAGFALRHHHGSGPEPEVPAPRRALAGTIAGWRSWSAMHTGYEGWGAERVRRSALVLQALTYAPSGAIVAAPTTSLPEVAGGSSNWDYRYAWLRDASLTMHALWVAACPDEAEGNFRWMARAGVGAEGDGGVQIVFGVEGERDLSERTLDHLAGYGGSTPVRVGNAAWRQTQLDVYGEVLASAHLLREQTDGFPELTADFLRGLANLAARRWRESDSGIWEGREGERRYLSSTLMCWVALDRAADMADALGADDDTRAAWVEQRDLIRAEILEQGWSESSQAYAGAFGSDNLDASVLLMPIVGFIPADDERMLATIDAIERELTTDGLVHRWTGAEDGAFVTCSFWLADCLARAGRLDRAIEVYGAAYGHANDLGLMSEEVDVSDGRMLGNFPQGLSHVGAITAAWSIDRARDRAAHALTGGGR